MKPEDLGIAGFTPEPTSEKERLVRLLQEKGAGTGEIFPCNCPKRAENRHVVDHGSEIMRTAAVVGARVKDLSAAAEAVGRDNVTLRSALDRSQAAGQRLSAENFYLKRALEEVRRHRALLFGLLVLAVLLWRL